MRCPWSSLRNIDEILFVHPSSEHHARVCASVSRILLRLDSRAPTHIGESLQTRNIGEENESIKSENVVLFDIIIYR